MKKIFILFCFCFFKNFFAAEVPSIIKQDELEIIEEVVSLTKIKLESLERLRQLIIHFKKTKLEFIDNPTSKKLASALVRTSQKIEQEMIISHFSQLFDEQFLKEIHFFAQVGRQSSPQNSNES